MRSRSARAPPPADKPEVDEEPTPQEIAELGAQALARAKEERRRRIERLSAHRAPAEPVKRSVRALVMTWADLDGWTRHYDPAEVAAKLTDAEWATVERVVAESTAFLDAVRTNRAGLA